jgi:hypothetical protein
MFVIDILDIRMPRNGGHSGIGQALNDFCGWSGHQKLSEST